jgi:glycosyltransferase involved in cell wall biosynthesis
MERNRGTGLMIEAFRNVLEYEPEARLLLVGHFMPPELQEEVEAAARALGIADAVTVTGRVPFSTIGDYLRRARVGWVSWQPVPKNEKNIPTKLFEYMSYALPIVSSDLASTRPFVTHGENGYLVKADMPSAHAGAIVDLLRHPERAEAMGVTGQRLVREKYNWAVMEGRLLDFYQKLLS